MGVVAGTIGGVEGPISTLTPQLLLRGETHRESAIEIPIPQEYNALLYILNGKIEVAGESFKGKQMLVLERDGTNISMKVSKGTRFILLWENPLGSR